MRTRGVFRLQRAGAGGSRWLTMVGLSLAIMVGWTTGGLAHSEPSARSLKEMLAQADLVFHGVVDTIEYVLSEPAGPEQVRIPYTLVTYRVARVFFGQAPGSQVTLQFIGGLNSENMRYMAASETPQFDVGDEDILFAQGNTVRPCPLVDNRHGRLRVVGSQLYTETGRAILLSQGDALDFGVRYRLAEVETTTVAGRVFAQRLPERGARSLPSNAVDAAKVMSLLDNLAQQVPAPKPFANASAAGPIAGPDMTPAAPPLEGATPRSR